MKYLKLSLDLLSYLIFISIVVYFCTEFRELPDTIPIHFNLFGQPDTVGHKNTLMIASVSMISPHFIFGAFSYIPQSYNYPFEIKEENRKDVYEIGKLYISSLRLLLDLMAAFLILMAVSGNRLFFYLNIATVVLSVLVTIGFIRLMRKTNNRPEADTDQS